jgi:hypothetical protein
MPQPGRESPYQGLIPFGEADAEFFFGRDREIRLITANLFAAPLTLLYGPSGVGKSSVLRAGVVHQLRRRDDLLVIIFTAWSGDPAADLKAAVSAAASPIAPPGLELPDPSQPLDEFLTVLADRLDRQVMIILDQFEEYFRYHPADDSFAAEFPRAVNRASADIRFLASFRDDALSKLDRFKGRIPNLFSNYLRIEHLDERGAHEAINKPLEQWSRVVEPDLPAYTIEPELEAVVIQRVKTGRVALGQAGRGLAQVAPDLPAGIETPYLQLVLTRLWNEERRLDLRTLRLDTFATLGGAEQIVRSHLDEVMLLRLTDEQWEDALLVFQYLVTPSGAKHAYKPADLPKMVHLDAQRVESLLQRLSEPESRLLRTVDIGGETGYEIYHDVLAQAFLDWRNRNLHEGSQALLGLLAIPLKIHAALRRKLARLRRDRLRRSIRDLGGAALGGLRSVRIFTYPKTVFLVPTLIAALVSGVGMRLIGDESASPRAAQSGPVARAPVEGGNARPGVGRFGITRVGLALAFLTVFGLNLLILAVDFPRFSCAALFLLPAVLGLVLLFFSAPTALPETLRAVANAGFYFALATTLLINFGVIWVTRWLDYWEILPNEILHNHGPFSDLERYPTLDLRKFDKDIPDIFEYIMLRSGRLTLYLAGALNKVVLDNVLWIDSKENELKRLLSRLEVRITSDEESGPAAGGVGFPEVRITSDEESGPAAGGVGLPHEGRA